MEPIAFLVLLAGGCWFWVDSLRSRELVLRHCTRYCLQLNVQLLDQTVFLTRLRPARDRDGHPCLRRWYSFDFSTDGGDRCKGNIRLLGSRVELIRMEHPEGPVILESDEDNVHRLQ